MSIYFSDTTDEELIKELKHRGYSTLLTSDADRIKDVIAPYENQTPVAWINKDGTYVELATKSTVYGSHTIPLIVRPDVVYATAGFPPNHTYNTTVTPLPGWMKGSTT